MTYKAFTAEMARLRGLASAAYSPDHFPGSDDWRLYALATQDVTWLCRAHPKHCEALKQETAALKAAAAAAPAPGSLMDRIARGVD